LTDPETSRWQNRRLLRCERSLSAWSRQLDAATAPSAVKEPPGTTASRRHGAAQAPRALRPGSTFAASARAPARTAESGARPSAARGPSGGWSRGQRGL